LATLVQLSAWNTLVTSGGVKAGDMAGARYRRVSIFALQFAPALGCYSYISSDESAEARQWGNRNINY